MPSDGLRLGFIIAHTIYIIINTVISSVVAGSLTLFIPHIISAVIWATYIPAAFILPIIRRRTNVRTVFDRAWGEMWYIGAQLFLWLVSMGLSIAQRTSSTCERPYPTYPVESIWLQWGGIIWDTDRFCRTMVAMAVESGIQSLLLIVWMVLLVNIVSKAKREVRGGWKVGVAELLRDDKEAKGYNLERDISHV
ncbi:hypothetical protein L198_05635 [Cryptococcus wingfieldii CBS 7118]|uniref:MARVEL domain-containing protein n=1 Tax=Cryptococcus wingfieldii CBS 7118 TaxID=1295528 RepID=A0A1E3IWA9_9TREE|nr:hypothetical protein L198_05635 [Cryptococcus wingfieldii CBS 7118]ODN92838.1 hypothetical protein L198_05635 [Cryptococcus wingfieldii CBS 7118]